MALSRRIDPEAAVARAGRALDAIDWRAGPITRSW